MESAIQDHDRHLTLSYTKSSWFWITAKQRQFQSVHAEVKYKGNLHSADGIRTDPNKVSAITNMKRSDYLKQCKVFIGLATYSSLFMSHLTVRNWRNFATPSRQGSPLVQSQQEEALQSVKSCVSQQPVLEIYDVHQEVTIQCDTCDFGLGATLLQNRQPVAYDSHAHQTPSRAKHILKWRELLLLLPARNSTILIFYGKICVSVQSDHKHLKLIF